MRNQCTISPVFKSITINPQRGSTPCCSNLVFIGKLAKIAAGVKQTHVKGSKVDTNFLSELAKQCNANENVVNQIKIANSARHVQEIILENKIDGFFDLVCTQVYNQMRKHSEEKVPIEVFLFDFDGNVLSKHPK